MEAQRRAHCCVICPFPNEQITLPPYCAQGCPVGNTLKHAINRIGDVAGSNSTGTSRSQTPDSYHFQCTFSPILSQHRKIAPCSLASLAKTLHLMHIQRQPPAPPYLQSLGRAKNGRHVQRLVPSSFSLFVHCCIRRVVADDRQERRRTSPFREFGKETPTPISQCAPTGPEQTRSGRSPDSSPGWQISWVPAMG
jgi:hypothetical protein